jgi:hypothetical protein
MGQGELASVWLMAKSAIVDWRDHAGPEHCLQTAWLRLAARDGIPEDVNFC